MTIQTLRKVQSFIQWMTDESVDDRISEYSSLLSKEEGIIPSTDVLLIEFFGHYFQLVNTILESCGESKNSLGFGSLTLFVDYLHDYVIGTDKDEDLFFETFAEKIHPVIRSIFEDLNTGFYKPDLVSNTLDYHKFLIDTAHQSDDWEEFISFMVDIPKRVYKKLKDLRALIQRDNAFDLDKLFFYEEPSENFVVNYKKTATSVVANEDLASARSFVLEIPV